MKVRNIIFDLGGVLVDLDKDRCVRAFQKIGASEAGLYVEERRTEDFFRDIELGLITTGEFCEQVRRSSHSSASDEEIIWAWDCLLLTISDEKKRKLLRLSAAGYRLFLLSNTNDMHWRLCRDKLFPYHGKGVDDYFDEIFLSYILHQSKPCPGIFRAVMERASLNAGETLFIDDDKDNIAAAASMGMSVLHVKDNGWLSEI